MEALEKMRNFLLTYPKWEQGGLMYIDYTDGVPGCCGLFPAGREEVARRGDVLGNIYVDCKLHFALYRVTDGQEDGWQNAQWLLEFQEWLEKQSVRGLAPRFGDVPLRERLRAEKGRLTKERPGHTGIYVVELTADFTKYYEVNENGEN